MAVPLFDYIRVPLAICPVKPRLACHPSAPIVPVARLPALYYVGVWLCDSLSVNLL
jgi:hypothetical protein